MVELQPLTAPPEPTRAVAPNVDGLSNHVRPDWESLILAHLDLNQAALDTLIRAQPLPAIPADEPDIVELTIPVAVSLR